MELDIVPFVQAGVAGGVLLWFMLRLEKRLRRFERTMHLMARTLIRQLEQQSSTPAAQDLSDQLYEIS